MTDELLAFFWEYGEALKGQPWHIVESEFDRLERKHLASLGEEDREEMRRMFHEAAWK